MAKTPRQLASVPPARVNSVIVLLVKARSKNFRDGLWSRSTRATPGSGMRMGYPSTSGCLRTYPVQRDPAVDARSVPTPRSGSAAAFHSA